jgi:hypothetical protein
MNEETQTPAPLVYEPIAKIVYNASENYYSPELPTEVTADKITTTFRNQKQLANIRDRHEKNVNSVRDYLIENFEELDEHAEAIANLLGIDLSAEIDVEFIVSVRATIAVPLGTTARDLSTYDFDVEIISNDSNYEIQDYDADIEDIRSR